jgi:radical SAM superfamily enzyme YgiQ (UPF0313 family)
MKIHLVKDSNKLRKYTYRTLDLLMEIHAIDSSEPEDADLFLVSVDDPDDLPLIKRARKLAGDRPLIAGGFEGFGGEYLLSYADAVCVGEGFEFFEVLGRTRNVDELYELPYMLTKEKQSVYPSTRIDVDRLPLVRIGPKLWYYLAGRGCRGKCAFCMTGFCYPGWHNSSIQLKRAVQYVEAQGHRLTLITNDSAEVDVSSKSRMVQSVRVKDYLKDPGRFKGAGMLHFGIEGWTEEQRRDFSKPIPDHMIMELIDILGKQRQPAEFFFIVGLPGTYDLMLDFANRVPVCAEPYPKVFIKLTRLDPSPHTPLWSYDLRRLERISATQFRTFHNAIKERNIRFRLYPMRGDARQTYKAVIRRCAPYEVKQVGSEPSPRTDDDAYMEYLDGSGLSHLLTYDGRPMPNSQIVTPWRKVRDRMADRLGMIPVAYKSDSFA